MNIQSDKNKIILSEEKLLDAVQNNDIQSLDDLLHPDLLFIIPNGQIITKAMDLDIYRSRDMKINDIKLIDQEINFVGDNAIVVVTTEMKGQYLDNTLDGKYRFIRVWKSFNAKWKIIAGSSTQLQ